MLCWGDLHSVDLEQLADIGRVLFGLYGPSPDGEDELQFIGRSEAFVLRLGCIVGALVNGDHRLHPGGGRMREAGIDPHKARVEVFTGADAYRREFALIRKLRPPANRIPNLGRPAGLRQWPGYI